MRALPPVAVSPIRLRHRDCPICGSDARNASVLPYGRDLWTVMNCHGCGFAFVATVPETVELEETLAWETRHGEENARRRRNNPIQQWLDRTFRWRLHLLPRTEPTDILNKLGPASGVVVDLGCGGGSRLQQINSRFSVCGIEVSRALAAEAQQVAAGRNGTVLHSSALEGLRTFADASLAGVLARGYLEHDADAGPVMKEIGRTLRADGMAVVKVPNYGSLNRRIMGRSWCGFRLPDHVNYFRQRDLARIADACGLRAIFPFLLSLPTDDNYVAILRPKLTPLMLARSHCHRAGGRSGQPIGGPKEQDRADRCHRVKGNIRAAYQDKSLRKEAMVCSTGPRCPAFT